MQQLLTIVCSVLREHEYVIIPGFGGFTLHHVPAKQNASHVFTPPSKVPSFNPLLNQDDGMLKHALISTSSVSPAEATQRIEAFTAHCNTLLQTRKTLVIPSLGTLYQNLDGSLAFEPAISSLWSLEHFGLEPVQAAFNPPEAKIIPLSKPWTVSNALLKTAIAASFLIISSLLAFMILKQPQYLNFAGITSNEPAQFQNNLITTPPLQTYRACSNLISTNITLPTPALNETGSCILVFGAFREAFNAQQLAKNLTRLGFKDPIRFEMVNTLIRVCSEKKYTPEVAAEKARHITALHQSVWISKKP